MSEYVEKVLHVKSEDLRLYDLTDEENPVHLDNEGLTVAELQFRDGQKLLVESENKPPHTHTAHKRLFVVVLSNVRTACAYSLYIYTYREMAPPIHLGAWSMAL